MKFSTSLLWTLIGYDINGVKVICEESICEDVAQSFLNVFSNSWKEALAKVEEVHGDCEFADVPAKIVKKDYGFFISVGALDIRYAYGDFYDDWYGFNAFQYALKSMKTTYPQVEYEGYICGILSDRLAGGPYHWNISSRGVVKPLDFVGEYLGNLFATGMYVPEKPLDADGVNFVVAGKLKFFKNREAITEYIEDLGGNVTGRITQETDYLISNDLNSTTSNNVKAKNLGIPIISETEFIAMFGNPGEFDLKQSEFWETFVEMISCDKDFAETIKVLYAYSDWIEKAVLDRTVRAILNIARECDEDAQDELVELVELVKQLESGEYVDCADKEDTVADNLPDGYMEALEMFMMAADLGGITPLPGEVISSKGTFELVIAQAEAGDANAKLTAGKYFIADHIEGETERAIQWIQEASDAGIEEATEYIHSHRELFHL